MLVFPFVHHAFEITDREYLADHSIMVELPLIGCAHGRVLPALPQRDPAPEQLPGAEKCQPSVTALRVLPIG